MYINNAAKKSIIITPEVDGNINVFADPNMVEVILRNLVSNSIKFSEKESKINISSKNENGFAIINVTDTGVGISKDKIDKLFQVGENVSTNGTENEEGSGLGLILCKEFVELNKGEISVESEAGNGSTFSFTLPLNKKE